MLRCSMIDGLRFIGGFSGAAASVWATNVVRSNVDECFFVACLNPRFIHYAGLSNVSLVAGNVIDSVVPFFERMRMKFATTSSVRCSTVPYLTYFRYIYFRKLKHVDSTVQS